MNVTNSTLQMNKKKEKAIDKVNREKILKDYEETGYIPYTINNNVYQIKLEHMHVLISDYKFPSNYVRNDIDGMALIRKILYILHGCKEIPELSTIALTIPKGEDREYWDYIDSIPSLTGYGVFITRNMIESLKDSEDMTENDYNWVMFIDDIKDLEDFQNKKAKYCRNFNIKSIREPVAVFCSKAIEYKDIKRIQLILKEIYLDLWFNCPFFDMYEQEYNTTKLLDNFKAHGDIQVYTIDDLILKENALFSPTIVDYHTVAWDFLQKLLSENKNLLIRMSENGLQSIGVNNKVSISFYDRDNNQNTYKLLYSVLAMYSVLSGNLVIVEVYENIYQRYVSQATSLESLPLYTRLANRKQDRYMMLHGTNVGLARLLDIENMTESLTLHEFNFQNLIDCYYNDRALKPNRVTRNIKDIELLDTYDFLIQESKAYEGLTLLGNTIPANSKFIGIDNLMKLVIGGLTQYVLNFRNIADMKNILIYKVKRDNKEEIKIALGDYSAMIKFKSYHKSVVSAKENNYVEYSSSVDLKSLDTLFRLNMYTDYYDLAEDLNIPTEDVKVKPIEYTEETIKMYFNDVITEFRNRKSFSFFDINQPRGYLLGKLFNKELRETESVLLPVLKEHVSIRNLYRTGVIDPYKGIEMKGANFKIEIDEKMFGSRHYLATKVK